MTNIPIMCGGVTVGFTGEVIIEHCKSKEDFVAWALPLPFYERMPLDQRVVALEEAYDIIIKVMGAQPTETIPADVVMPEAAIPVVEVELPVIAKEEPEEE